MGSYMETIDVVEREHASTCQLQYGMYWNLTWPTVAERTLLKLLARAHVHERELTFTIASPCR